MRDKREEEEGGSERDQQPCCERCREMEGREEERQKRARQTRSASRAAQGGIPGLVGPRPASGGLPKPRPSPGRDAACTHAGPECAASILLRVWLLLPWRGLH